MTVWEWTGVLAGCLGTLIGVAMGVLAIIWTVQDFRDRS
jgi:ABC-type lipoprotein release transport system permease subunit